MKQEGRVEERSQEAGHDCLEKYVKLEEISLGVEGNLGTEALRLVEENSASFLEKETISLLFCIKN